MVNKYKRETFGLFVIIGFILIIFVFFELMYNNSIRFSKASGFYEEGFELRIIGGGENRIYYTLDGSEPTTESSLYDKKSSIVIEDATANENVYSARTDVSTDFSTELIEEYSSGKRNYTIPDYNVDKCNIIKASVFDEDGVCLDTIEAVYYVGFEGKQGYDKVYIASITTDPDNLFDYEEGIYNTGLLFDQYVETELEGDSGIWTAPYWWWWGANYRQGGRESERNATVTIFNENRELLLTQKCGMRIQGGGSRGLLPKSIGCFARKEYSGSNEFSVDLFEKDIFPHKFVFFSGGDDNVFKLKDYLVNNLAQDLNFSTMDFIPCAMFLDGEYWGMYYLTENYNADYVSDHYNVDKDEVIIFKDGEVTEGEETDFDIFRDMRMYICENDMTREENYLQACELIDIESYIDYYASQIYIARYNDWPVSNYAAWRTRSTDGIQYGDGKWRWMLFDVNSGGLNIYVVNEDTLKYVLEADGVFYSLYQNEEFRKKFAERILYIGKEIYTMEKCEKLIDDYAETMKEPLMMSNLRFYNSTREDEFKTNVENMKSFFELRYDVVWDMLVNNMGGIWLEENGIQK